MSPRPTMTIDRREVPIEGERNILEVARKAGIDIPTFCYHSDLSIYGACRLCLVDVEGRGIVTSCSTPPEPGMKVKTHTEEIRQIRKVAVELLLDQLDLGESEAIVLARELKAELLLMDERRGRCRALQSGLTVVGTLGILIQARQRGLVGPLRPLLDQLRQLPFHMSESLYTEVLRHVGE